MWPVYMHAKFHWIRPTVWPQYTNVTDRQTGQAGETGQRGRLSDTNGRPKMGHVP